MKDRGIAYRKMFDAYSAGEMAYALELSREFAPQLCLSCAGTLSGGFEKAIEVTPDYPQAIAAKNDVAKAMAYLRDSSP